MEANVILPVIVSLGGSILVWWGAYRAFAAKTEEWREAVTHRFLELEERIKRIDQVLEMLRRRSHRQSSRILTHELEIDQIVHKLSIPRSRRRDDGDNDDSEF